MYYLFEYIVPPGKNTYVPNKCLCKVNCDSAETNNDLITELRVLGISTKYQGEDWKTLWLNIEHENVYSAGNYNKIIDLVKKFSRNEKLESLLDG